MTSDDSGRESTYCERYLDSYSLHGPCESWGTILNSTLIFSVCPLQKVEFIRGINVTDSWFWTEWGSRGKGQPFQLEHWQRFWGEAIRAEWRSWSVSLPSWSWNLERKVNMMKYRQLFQCVRIVGICLEWGHSCCVLRLFYSCHFSALTLTANACKRDCLCVYLWLKGSRIDIHWVQHLSGKENKKVCPCWKKTAPMAKHLTV